MIGLIFVIISVPWRIVGKGLIFPEESLMIYTCTALVMSTFFEEVFFRGFIQTRFERAFGILPAIVLSGLTFSLFHLGYPGYRNLNQLIILFLVGMFFALAFRTTNNIITSFTLNLPHAIIHFIEKQTYFEENIFIIDIITIVIGIFLLIIIDVKQKIKFR